MRTTLKVYENRVLNLTLIEPYVTMEYVENKHCRLTVKWNSPVSGSIVSNSQVTCFVRISKPARTFTYTPKSSTRFKFSCKSIRYQVQLLKRSQTVILQLLVHFKFLGTYLIEIHVTLIYDKEPGRHITTLSTF